MVLMKQGHFRNPDSTRLFHYSDRTRQGAGDFLTLITQDYLMILITQGYFHVH